MGEYAAQSVATVSPKNRNNLECALAEAAYMTGLERNADVVRMASYAPLFAHADGWQWTPDLIWCDNLRIYGTPNYYVQQLFSRNRGDIVLPTQTEFGESASAHSNGGTAAVIPGLFATASQDEKAHEIILKIINPAAEPRKIDIVLQGSNHLSPKAKVITLAGSSPDDENSFESPTSIAPVSSSFEGVSPRFTFECRARSLSVLRVGSRP
jgi:alpha-N-arabinofuranosidase